MLRRTAIAAAVSLLAALTHGAAVRAQDLTVFAAASMTNALEEAAALWAAAGGPAPRLSFASSSALARQIEQGAPASVFVSADEQWMDHLQQRGLIATETRSSLLGNTLVLIAPASAGAAEVPLARGTDLLALLRGGRLAVGDPDHVPAGRYARSALEWMGSWDAVAPRLARADNVRVALALVERGEAPYGIVYATDAAAAGGVRVIGTFPAESHEPITYPVAVVGAQDGPSARRFIEYLRSDAAAAVFRRHGFSVLE